MAIQFCSAEVGAEGTAGNVLAASQRQSGRTRWTRLHRACLLAVLLVLTGPSGAEIARDIERRTDELRSVSRDLPSDPTVAVKVRELQDAIRRGEAASAELWADIKKLEDEKAALQDANLKLERIQTVLASGLIGALVTAAVAILGALSSARRSRAEQDLRRLDVLEKACALQAKGIDIPADIRVAYGAPAKSG